MCAERNMSADDKSKPAGKKRKVAEENRMFNSLWELEYLFLMPNDKPVCLICHNIVAVAKKANLQRHYRTMHGDFEKNYPSGSKIREDKFNSLKRSLLSQQTTFRRMMKATDCVTEASLQISWVLAKKQKPLSDGETVKECFQECAESLFADFHQRQKLKNKYQTFHCLTRQLPDESKCCHVISCRSCAVI